MRAVTRHRWNFARAAGDSARPSLRPILLAGACALLVTPLESAPWSPAPAPVPAGETELSPANPDPALNAASSAGRSNSGPAGVEPAVAVAATAPIVPVPVDFAPIVAIDLLPPRSQDPAIPVAPVEVVALVLRPVVLDIPRAPRIDALASVHPSARPDAAIMPARSSAAWSPAMIEQLSDPAQSSVQMAQLHEPGVGAPVTLSDRVASMQVPLPPPPRLTGEERAALLAGSPDDLIVRLGEVEVGKVPFRMTDMRIITVQLSGLLDLVEGTMEPADYSRLRNSPAANTFVPIDQLRDAGIGVRYDPVYDELRLSV